MNILARVSTPLMRCATLFQGNDLLPLMRRTPSVYSPHAKAFWGVRVTSDYAADNHREEEAGNFQDALSQ